MTTLTPEAATKAYAYRNAVIVMLAGFVFATFSLRVAGFDVLLDPVGWLLVFNGVRPIEKPGGGLGLRAILCLGLLALSAAQLFVAAEGVAIVLLLLRDVLEFLFFILLARPFGRLLESFELGRAKRYFRLFLVLNAIASPLLTLAMVLVVNFAVQVYALILVFSALGFLLRLMLAVALAWLAWKLNSLAAAAPR